MKFLLELIASLRGVIVGLLLFLNLLFWVFLLYIFAIPMYLSPKKSAWRRWWRHKILAFPYSWQTCHCLLLMITTPVDWQITGTDNLKRKDWYLLISNHVSWLDIIVLFRTFWRKIPFLKFFMKRELIWQFPFGAQACAILDFPFMTRYSKEFLRKNPHLKGKDIETTRLACDKFASTPTSVINFVEGGRFTEAKHQRQNSPYKHLLKPKAGGIAFTLNAMNHSLHKLLNITIVYPHKDISLWQFLCGKVKKITVNVEQIPITEQWYGDYENDREFRAVFQNKINELWQAKDKLIDDIRQDQNKIQETTQIDTTDVVS